MTTPQSCAAWSQQAFTEVNLGMRVLGKTSAIQKLARQVQSAKAELDRLERMLTTIDPSVPPCGITTDWIKGILEARRRREAVFSGANFSDPGWDIILATYALQLANERATITDVCRLAAVRASTGLRWVRELEGAGLLIQKDDEKDGRRILLELSGTGVDAMRRYFLGRDPRGVGI